MQDDLQQAARYQQEIPLAYQWLARIISLLFHPIFILTYAYILLAYFNPYMFKEATTERVFAFDGETAKGRLFIYWMVFTAVIPIVGIVVMKGLGMVSSLSLPTQDERKIPYVLTGMFYMSLVAANSYNDNMPMLLKSFALGATIALFVAFFINLFSKISMHTVGMGGFLAMVMIVMVLGESKYNGINQIFVFVILMCGLVGTSRMLLGAHKPSDLYGGYLVGFMPQFVALSYTFT